MLESVSVRQPHILAFKGRLVSSVLDGASALDLQLVECAVAMPMGIHRKVPRGY
jgi:hypothetical protein